MPAGDALAAAGASAGVPTAHMRDCSAPGTCSEQRILALLCPRHVYSCLTALRCKRSQAGKGCASQVGMHRRHEKKAAINLPHPGGLVSALDAPETVLRSTLSVQHCECVQSFE